MLGPALLGSTTLRPRVWEALAAEEESGLVADGVLEVAPDRDTGAPVVRRMRCWVPKESEVED